MAGQFQLLEVLVLGDGGLDTDRTFAHQVFEPSTEGSDHLVPGADLLHERFQVALLPEVTFVVYLRQATKLFGLIEHGDDGEVALQKIGHATAVGITGVLSFTKTRPAPTGQLGFDRASFRFNYGWELAQAEVGLLTAFTWPSRKGDEAKRLDPLVRMPALTTHRTILRYDFHTLFSLDQEPAQRIFFVTFIEVALIASQFHDLAQFFEGQVLGGLVKCLDEFSRLDIAASRLE